MTKKFEILIVEDDISLCQQLTDLIEDSEDMYLIASTNDSEQATKLIQDTLPDVVILDLELHQGCGSGLNVLHNVQSLSLAKKPYFLVTTNNSSSTTYQAARNLGADYIMSKHQNEYSPASVLDFIRIMRSSILENQKNSGVHETIETPEQHTKRIQQRIFTELNHVGINPKSVGYTYLAEAIYIIAKTPSQNIYDVLADKYKKSEASIERAMQNAINKAWKTYDIDELLHYYKAKISSAKGNPTITEFVCYYANLIKNEY